MTRLDAVRNSCPGAETERFYSLGMFFRSHQIGLRPQWICQLGCPTYAASCIFRRLQVTLTELDVFFVFLPFLR